MRNEKIRVLVLDDEASIVGPLKSILDIMGFETFGATKGDEAVTIFSREKIQICVLDVNLNDPQMDGIDVLETIKQMDQNAVCIIFTQTSKPEVIARAGDLGVYEYLNKPLDPAVLKRVVKEAAEIIEKKGIQPTDAV